jgi:hypothetical protein
MTAGPRRSSGRDEQMFGDKQQNPPEAASDYAAEEAFRCWTNRTDEQAQSTWITTMLKTITAGLLALLAAMTHANAADITVGKFKDSENSYVKVWGEIVDGDGKKFADALNDVSVKGVLLNSNGGSFEDGMAMAKLVYERKLWTSVRKNWECESMCAIIWIAGTVRYYGPKTKIGFHGVSTSWEVNEGNGRKGRKYEPYSAGNALVGAFFNQLGLWDIAIVALTSAKHDSMFWLNTKRLEELGIKATLSTIE